MAAAGLVGLGELVPEEEAMLVLGDELLEEADGVDGDTASSFMAGTTAALVVVVGGGDGDGDGGCGGTLKSSLMAGTAG